MVRDARQRSDSFRRLTGFPHAGRKALTLYSMPPVDELPASDTCLQQTKSALFFLFSPVTISCQEILWRRRTMRWFPTTW